jgi:tRNA(Ile)-lysidine synthase
MALLALLAALHARGGRAPEPVAVTIHHGLRDEADEECALVARFARSIGVACERRDLRLERGPDLAARARVARYEALALAADRWEADWVATGHHAEDRLETLLLAIGRGRGLRGVAAPRWWRRLAPGVRLVRPLLDVAKSDCAALLDACDIAYADDPSNLDPNRARGHLRRAVLPHIVARWPHAARNASAAIDEAILARAALERSVTRRFGPASTLRWPRDRFVGCDVELAAWALRRSAERVGRAAWRRAASAAVDERQSPRVFRWGRLLLRVGGEMIAIESGAHEESSR